MERKQYYVCVRLRMLSWLQERGFECVGVLPDFNNPSFRVFKFEWTDELDEAIHEYFDSKKNK